MTMMLSVLLALAFLSIAQGFLRSTPAAPAAAAPAAAAAAAAVLPTSLGKSYIAEPFITHLASTSDGQHLVATTVTKLYTSSDYGKSWTERSLTSLNWASLACSGNDLYLYASEANGVVHRSKILGPHGPLS